MESSINGDVPLFKDELWKDFNQKSLISSPQCHPNIWEYLLQVPLTRRKFLEEIVEGIKSFIRSCTKTKKCAMVANLIDNWNHVLKIPGYPNDSHELIKIAILRTNKEQIPNNLKKIYIDRYGCSKGLERYLESNHPLAVLKGGLDAFDKLPASFVLAQPFQIELTGKIDLNKLYQIKYKTIHPSWWETDFFQDHLFNLTLPALDLQELEPLPQQALRFLATSPKVSSGTKLKLSLLIDDPSYFEQNLDEKDLEGLNFVPFFTRLKSKKFILYFFERVYDLLPEKQKRKIYSWIEFNRVLLFDEAVLRKKLFPFFSNALACLFIDSCDRDTLTLYLREHLDFFQSIKSSQEAVETINRLSKRGVLDLSLNLDLPLDKVDQIVSWDNLTVLKNLFLASLSGYSVDPLKLERAYERLSPSIIPSKDRNEFIFRQASSLIARGRSDDGIFKLIQLGHHQQAKRLLERIVEDRVGQKPPSGFGANPQSIIWLMNLAKK